MEEKEIIRRCLAGETDLFEWLVLKYQAQIISLTWSLLGNHEEAQDITQEAFIQAYTHLNRFDQDRSFLTWLYAIAYNRCLDFWKKKKSLSRRLVGFFHELRSRDQAHPEKSGELPGSLLQCHWLNYLNAKERLAVILKIGEGYRASEIGEILGCAESTARVYLFNAKRKLQKYMGSYQNVSVL